ncbi:serine racemase VanT catalytic subunit [Anaerocolumna sedimenticola]|uniref:Alanine racemase n=1 Tax=Anaerocolumna sedimenticola TaxID=2696063 RepID=A0A6P1TSG8_9FIRM|nr:serine racemase VanT catalytic subunit [Anaerocolumna sedimenticola]QHQ62388.1 serine racemase VanT catalytic subunit [Anaerocolumna sedimenticola]
MNHITTARKGQTNLIKENYDGLDYFRMIAAFLIVAIHTSPLTSINTTADFVFTRIIARVAVPFFFMVTGFFIISGFLKDNSFRNPDKYSVKPDTAPLTKFLKKTADLYGIAMLIYIPVNLYSGYFKQNNMFLKLLKDILFNGTMYHLWYLPAVITGVLFVYLLLKINKGTVFLLISIILYLAGLLGDSYYGLTESIPILKNCYDFLFQLFDYTRNGIFYAPVFLVMGAFIARSVKPLSLRKCIAGFIASSVLLFIEGLLLHAHNMQRHDSMYLFLIPSMYFLFQLLLHFKGNYYRSFRTFSMIIYIIHPFAIILVRGLAKVLGLEDFLIYNSLIHYLAVCLLSLVFGYFYVYAIRHIKQGKPDIKGRAWIEINLNHLRHNVKEFQSILPKNCTLMAVVKANAYGHGDIRISKELNKIGVTSFAVATLSEGVQLRKNGVKGEILIFGYTHPQDFKLLVKYRLIQTVVDLEYAQILNRYGSKIKVHIKIDTGMHRLGENYNNISNLEAIFNLKNLVILGAYTHLSVSDSLTKENTAFTKAQIEHFYKTIQNLNDFGYNPGRLHIQSSYGVLNYPELSCDYARIGIALYGVLSSAYDKTRVSIDLKPVLSVKARIVMTKTIEKGDAVSYGRTFTASEERKIATVTIGYADGIPRNLEDGYILVNGYPAPIIGRICMDQLMIDITDIPGVEPDEIVTVIGINETNQIKAEEIAMNSGTITNELLTRLGNRLKRIYIN